MSGISVRVGMQITEGQFNSSITRVRPFFQLLLKTDPSGLNWLPRLLQLANRNQQFASQLAATSGTLLPETLKPRRYEDRVLKKYGLEAIELEGCFEVSLQPCTRFLEWLINNPSRLSWPMDGAKERGFGEQTQKWRTALKNGDRGAINEALEQLGRRGSKGSKRKWWAFEGFTEVDCYLETDRLILLIEGKRTEGLSPATDWFPQRNQIVRNLEVAHEIAGQKGKEYAVLVIAEQELAPITEKVFAASLPHLSSQQRDEIGRHYLGSTTWAAASGALGIDFFALPEKTVDTLL